MKFSLIVADLPWSFSDSLQMSAVPRSAQANYSTMSNQALLDLPVQDVLEENALLCLWTPSSLLSLGLQVLEKWGFVQKQTLPWIKVKIDPLATLRKQILAQFKKPEITAADINKCFDEYSLNDTLAFGMGRLFRQTHEMVLIGVKGKIYDQLQNKSQRSVLFGVNTKHSRKPDELQDRLELMFPEAKKLEMFARREKIGWHCIGNQCPSSLNEDIIDSLERLKNLP